MIWTALASSGHLASFDRRKCKGPCRVPRRPAAALPRGLDAPSGARAAIQRRARRRRGGLQYYNFVDRFDTFGLGNNTPFANGTNSDSLLACGRTEPGWCSACRILGFFSRGMDGRIDDPKAGWKGRAIYADYGPNAVWHMEGGLGTRSAVVKFQLRPDPLAR